MAPAQLRVILPGWDVSAGAQKSASRGFGGHAEDRHLILRFVEEGVHGMASEPKEIVPGQLSQAMPDSGSLSTNY